MQVSPTAVMVMTARGPSTIIAEGGSQAWVLNPKNAKRHPFLVCVQNRHNGTWGNATEPHGTPFLVGRISSVERSPENPDRYIVRVSEYARIAAPPVMWPGRNPVRYVSLAEFGIDPASLAWTPMPTPVAATPPIEEDEDSESLAPEVPPEITGIVPEFRNRIAVMLGIEPGRVRITIEA